MTKPLTFVQLTDTHIVALGHLAYGRLDTAAYLRLMLKRVQALPQQPAALVITGDLVDAGKRDEYVCLQSILAPMHLPIYLMAGNHDDRKQLRAVFQDHTYLQEGEFLQYRVRIGLLHLIALDTSVPGQSGGALCELRLNWLEQQLAATNGEPTVIAMHHPPFATLMAAMDNIGLLRGSDELDALLRRHPNVERVICGHTHRAIDVRFGSTLASTCPSPAHQITLNFDRKAEADWVLEPPAFRIHAWDTANARLVTHLVPSGRFEGPYSFAGEMA